MQRRRDGLSALLDRQTVVVPVTAPSGFSYTTRKNGDVVITHDGRQAAVLRGRTAEKFLAKVESNDPQELMARSTGNYKRGNEKR